MWVPSFFSVLHDLWRFLFGFNTAATSSAAMQGLAPRASMAVQHRPTRQPLIVQDKTAVLSPEIKLIPGVTYTSESIETLSIRRKLHSYGVQLQSTGNLRLIEWLAYKVCLAHESISPIPLLMTPVGRWHQTLKGTVGVQIGLQPATGAVVEWFDEQHTGHAGYVLQVAPTNQITVATLTQAPDGTYQEKVHTVQDWKEKGAVFTRFRA